MPEYSGKVAIVTGGASGIGLGIAAHLVAEGAKVVIADMNAANGVRVAEELNKGYETRVAAFCLTNVTEWDSQVALFEFSYATFGPRIDYFFANAGIAQMREIRSSDPTHFASAQINDLATLAGNPPNLSVVRVNLDGVLYSLYAALAYFRKQEKDSDGWRGKFVATGSNASFYPFPNDTLYGAAKNGVLGMVRAAGPRVLSEGITVNCFGPSVVATGLAPPAFIQRLEREDRLTPMKTITNAVDIFIRPSSRITGHIIENCADKNVFRAVPAYLDAKARANMDEFYPSDEIDAATSLEGLGYEVL